jgi:hypothetical protein
MQGIPHFRGTACFNQSGMCRTNTPTSDYWVSFAKPAFSIRCRSEGFSMVEEPNRFDVVVTLFSMSTTPQKRASAIRKADQAPSDFFRFQGGVVALYLGDPCV